MNEPKDKAHPLTDQELIDQVKNNDNDVALVSLMNRYLPMIKSMAGRYYARGMDFDDWKQEAALIMVKIVRRYDINRRICFGAYFRSCLKNRFYDYIRKQSAKKRIPNNRLTSYSANQVQYDDILRDVKAIHPERMMLVTEDIIRLMIHCSPFERQVIIGDVVNHQSFSQIAKLNHCSISKVQSASERYRRKFKQMRDTGLD